MAVETKAPESKFIYVLVVARRARQLMSGARPLADNPRSRKPTHIAREELDLGLLEFEVPPLPEGTDEKEGKRRK
jgi:DNA-directed RNA polymerase omega subunit